MRSSWLLGRRDEARTTAVTRSWTEVSLRPVASGGDTHHGSFVILLPLGASDTFLHDHYIPWIIILDPDEWHVLACGISKGRALTVLIRGGGWWARILYSPAGQSMLSPKFY